MDCAGAALAAVAGVSQEKLRCWVPEQSWQPGEEELVVLCELFVLFCY